MAIPLPDLDDRRWSDLVDEARALLPIHAPTWTDHNVHDPGITLLELAAWVTENGIYRINRIPDLHRRRFLELVGMPPRDPQGAHTVVAFTPETGSAPLVLPAGVEVETGSEPGVPFRTLVPVTVVDVSLAAWLTVGPDGRPAEGLARLSRGATVLPFGEDPGVGAACYFGFDGPIPQNAPISVWVDVVDGHDRENVLERTDHGCGVPRSLRTCDPKPDDAPRPDPWTDLPDHHGVRLAAEVLTADGKWQPLTGGAFRDGTRALTVSGALEFAVGFSTHATSLGDVEDALHYVRLRIAGGLHDAAPRVGAVIVNAAPCVQEVDADGTPLHTHGGPSRSFETAGTGDGQPGQTLELAAPMVARGSMLLETIESGGVVRLWERRPDLTTSTRGDAHYVLDAESGDVTFGDGERGRVVPKDAVVLAAYRSTAGAAGNVDAHAVARLSDSAANHDALRDAIDVQAPPFTLTNPLPAVGGEDAESLGDAMGRALDAARSTRRAVTLEDVENLALETPGTRVARVKAWANLHPALVCTHATGVVTVTVLPSLPDGKPVPTRGLLCAVRAHLNRFRILGTRFEVVGPTYVPVAVHAEVRACARTHPDALRSRISEALDRFLDPLTGGDDGEGWPFGRDVHRAEILAVIDGVSGVEHVLSLELESGGERVCGNLCVPPTGLVCGEEHDLDIRRAES